MHCNSCSKQRTRPSTQIGEEEYEGILKLGYTVINGAKEEQPMSADPTTISNLSFAMIQIQTEIVQTANGPRTIEITSLGGTFLVWIGSGNRQDGRLCSDWAVGMPQVFLFLFSIEGQK